MGDIVKENLRRGMAAYSRLKQGRRISFLFLRAFVFLIVVFLLPCLEAQDWQKIAPKTLPQSEGQVEMPPPPSAPTVTGTKVLVNQLKGLVIVDKADKVVKTGLTGIEGVKAEGFPILQTPEFNKVVEGYLGKEVTMNSLNSLVRDIVIYYRENDRPVVDVIVPEQDITLGVIQLIVLEGRLGEVRVEGGKWSNKKFLAQQVRLKPGEVFREGALMNDLSWINNNPFRDVNFIYTPGVELGTADIVLQTADRFPFRYFAGYEDSGTDITGDERFLTGVNLGNVFGLNQQANYQFTGDMDFDKLVAHSGSYIIPLPWRHTLNIFGSYVFSKADLPPPTQLKGHSWQASFRYTMPMPDIYDYKQDFQIGYDFKESNNDLEFGGAAVIGSLTNIAQWVAQYDGSMKDPLGATSFSATLYASPGKWTGRNRNELFQQMRAGANADYFYTQINLNRVTRLPADFTLANRFTYQRSTANLLGSEQLGLGGYSTIRGYDERIVNGDEGYIISTELRSTSLKIVKDIDSNEFQLLLFWDVGRIWNKYLLPEETPHYLLQSAGAGFRYTVNPYVSVRFDWGFQLYENPVISPRGKSRAHVGVVVGY